MATANSTPKNPVAPELTASSIYDAASSEIRAFALAHAGLEFPEESSREYMISEVCAAMDWVQRDPADGATHAVIKIGKTATQGGSEPVRGGLNGTMFTIKREVEVTVPIGYYNVLMDANSVGFTVASMEKAKPGTPDEDRIETSKYPIQVLRFIKKA